MPGLSEHLSREFKTEEPQTIQHFGILRKIGVVFKIPNDCGEHYSCEMTRTLNKNQERGCNLILILDYTTKVAYLSYDDN